ncbi:hypothetical protein WR25_08919 [Diploscapter pachys]|uniref:Large ribosomal subunit protein mL44 dsRNA binding domain-containing protein n=1 Tax=Diploscapter pachys TaxID=2018661 RepID=A0A2A2LS64_9BILA|nr:hypothetical protein WR25_08919 [Diploscapter pachys]
MLQRQSTLIVSSGKSFVQQYRNIRNCVQKFPHKENLQNRIPLASNSMDTCHVHHDQSSKSKSPDVSHHIGHTEIDIFKKVGVNKLLKNYENPLRNETIADSLYLLAATLSSERRTSFLIDYIVAQIVDIDFTEIFPLKDPYAVLVDLHKMNGAKSLEPRLLRYSQNSGNPIYVMAIYKDQYELVGQNVGNRLDIAFELAARDGLLKMWGITSD